MIGRSKLSVKVDFATNVSFTQRFFHTTLIMQNHPQSPEYQPQQSPFPPPQSFYGHLLLFQCYQEEEDKEQALSILSKLPALAQCEEESQSTIQLPL